MLVTEGHWRSIQQVVKESKGGRTTERLIEDKCHSTATHIQEKYQCVLSKNFPSHKYHFPQHWNQIFDPGHSVRSYAQLLLSRQHGYKLLVLSVHRQKYFVVFPSHVTVTRWKNNNKLILKTSQTCCKVCVKHCVTDMGCPPKQNLLFLHLWLCKYCMCHCKSWPTSQEFDKGNWWTHLWCCFLWLLCITHQVWPA